jgi:hypothetical protein
MEDEKKLETPDTNNTKPGFTLDDVAPLILRHDKDLKRSIDDISIVSDYILKSKSSYRLLNDKDLVIICASIIAIFAMFIVPNPAIIISSVLSGMFGLATGRMMGDSSESGHGDAKNGQ